MTASTDLTRDDVLHALRTHVATHVALPGERVYERAMPWNVAVPVQPAAVVVGATCADDVAGTVRLAAAHDVPIAVQATGHGASTPSGGRSWRPPPDGRRRRRPAARTARVGAGATWAGRAGRGGAARAGAAERVLDRCGRGRLLTGGGVGPSVAPSAGRPSASAAFEVVTADGGAPRRRRTSRSCSGGCAAARRRRHRHVEIDLLPIADLRRRDLFRGGGGPGWCAPGQPGPPICRRRSPRCIQQLPPLPGIPEPLAGRMTVAVATPRGDFAEAERLLAPMRASAPALIDGVGGAAVRRDRWRALRPGGSDARPTRVMRCSRSCRSTPSTRSWPSPARVGVPAGDRRLRQLGGALAREPRHRSAFCHRDAAYSLAVIGAPMPATAAWSPSTPRGRGGDGAVVHRRPDAQLRAVV